MPFIVSAWCDSYRLSHAAGMVPMPMYEEHYREYVKWVLARSGVRLIVACHPESTSDLYGFASVEHDVMVPRQERSKGSWQRRVSPAGMPMLQYVYVKQAYRKLGIGTGLVMAAGLNPAEPFLFAAKTPVVKDCPLFANGRWSPLTIRYPKE